MNDTLSTIYMFVLFFSPIIILGSSYILYKYVQTKKNRYIVYIIYFIVSYYLNSINISFKYNTLDFVLNYLALISICDILWNIVLIKNKAIKITFIIIIGLLIGLLSLAWMIGSVAGIPDYITNKKMATYQIDNIVYKIFEQDPSTATNHNKIFSLKKIYSKSMFEREVDSWSTGESRRYKQEPTFSIYESGDSTYIYIIYPNLLNNNYLPDDTVYTFKINKLYNNGLNADR